MKITLYILILVCFCGCYRDHKTPQLKRDSSLITVGCDSLLRSGWDTTLYQKKKNLKPGQYFKILGDLNFDDGNWIALIVVEHGFRWKWSDSNYFSQLGYYILTDKSKLKAMQEDWTVQYLGADCCTDDFSIYFLRDNKLVFGTGIISDGQEGFQNSIYGYTTLKEGKTLRAYYKYFQLCNQNPKGVGGFRD